MKILAIRGRNLASLAGDFEVDFSGEPLASAGLFAICGPTGAGKSTLLDALCLALYDATPRMARARDATGRGTALPDVAGETIGARDTRTLLRRGAAEGHAEVDFVGGDGIAYRARWSVRRARSRASGKLQDTQMALARLPGGEPVGGGLKSEVKPAIVERIGLTFEQFTRAVLLAQNEFFAFLKADDDERAELLQALTGTERFEAISRRAHERNKAEQERLRGLRDQLDADPPLDAATRLEIEQQQQRHAEEAAALDSRMRELDASVSWHERDAQLAHASQEAALALQSALSARDAAAPRRSRLESVRLAQQARPLVTELDRLGKQAAAARAEADASRAAWLAAQQAADLAQQQRRHALAARDAAAQAQAAAAPRIARARELDTVIATLLPGHRNALAARNDAAAAAAQARARLDRVQAERAQAVAALGATQQWLDQHASLAALGSQWLRWEQALHQAASWHGAHGRLTAEIARHTAALGAARPRLAQAEQALGEAVAALEPAQEQCQRWRDELAAQDRDAIAARLQAARHQSAALQRAEQLLLALWRAEQGLAELRQHTDRVQARHRECLSRLEQHRVQRPAAEQARDSAERAWRLAAAACHESVETLRNALEPDAPCPVCGATSHPYAGDAAQPLRKVLDALEQDYHRCAQALAALDAAGHGDRATAAALQEELDMLRAREASLQGERDAAAAAWQAHPLAASVAAQSELWADLDECRLRLAQLSEAAAAEERQAAADDAAVRALDLRLQQAMAELERLRAARQLAQDRREQLHGELAQIESRQSAASEQQQTLAASIDGALISLDDGALGAARLALLASRDPHARWQDAWSADPAAFAAHCAQLAGQWNDTTREHEALRQRVTTADQAIAAATDALQGALQQQQRAADAFATQDRELAGKRALRDAVFTDPRDRERSVDAIAAQLEAAMSGAAAAVERADAACQQAAQRIASEAARFERAEETTVRVQQDQLAARAQLDAWLERQALQEPALRELLAIGMEQVAQEEEALRALERDVDACGALAAARQAERQRWQEQRPVLSAEAQECIEAWTAGNTEVITEATAPCASHADAVRSEALRDALAHMRQQRDMVGKAQAEASFALRRDDERRQQGAALLERIERQENEARIWQVMHELIGSADGKKFRNHAQQMTLDILLGYANRHLATLSRRYRMERLPDSLGLLVVDQDMGDEARSVHSLSGGESFLVSLSLALGLASLSSHRVRVESLFIDEGFGSLDSDTLRVAMDALDNLQSQGRKVGVISHVHEMTERIGTRIELRRLAGGQSRIAVTGGEPA
ncbi:AAA family ATPase [Cupriavidus sp. AU9028]|uniref:AAA family ATPase n=1 Tax=Cupriavidus sp. AU9028 TaxID=2871157 RepID=UPI001C937AEF|nr:AAA family ATPase [Cupriavidus sp. AU9028]MBY4896620.1 AAA family ATPase [Cupriavidus sp. AU9028]